MTCCGRCGLPPRFKGFHEKYYHPSNARFWFYGDDDPEERLRILGAFLDEFDARPVDSAITPQPLFTVGAPSPHHVPSWGSCTIDAPWQMSASMLQSVAQEAAHILLQICAAAACDTWAVDGLEKCLCYSPSTVGCSDIPKW
jgi:hypothetical protein